MAAAVDPVLKRHSGIARALATIVASLLLLQLVFAGAPAVAGADVGVLCSTQDGPAQLEPGSERPTVPHGGHRHGLCCILHCGALDAPPPKPYASVEAPIVPSAAIETAPTQSAPELRVEPKGAPQSPRAPPLAAPAVSA
jgi:hypothetical protein